MNALLPLWSGGTAAGIAWLYLITNSARIFTYLPQIVAVWRCRDGARAISLFTWYSWVASHLASIAYGVLVIHDVFFVAISGINFAGCAAVAGLATRRRGQCERRAPLQVSTHDARPVAPVMTREVRQREPASVVDCRRAGLPDGALPQQCTAAQTPLRRRTDVRPPARIEPLEWAAR